MNSVNRKKAAFQSGENKRFINLHLLYSVRRLPLKMVGGWVDPSGGWIPFPSATPAVRLPQSHSQSPRLPHGAKSPFPNAHGNHGTRTRSSQNRIPNLDL